MLMLRTPCVFLVLLCVVTATRTTLETIQSQVQTILDEEALLWNTSFQAGFSSTYGEFGVAAGKLDASSHSNTPMTPDVMIPVGSATKAYTAATIIKLVDEGHIDLDTPVYKYVDAVLTRLNGTTLLQLWKGDRTVQTVTVRQLLHMSSGLNDYNDEALQTFTNNFPGEDKTGVDLLHELDKTFLFLPGTGAAYSSVGFTLLGYVMVGATSSSQGGTWNDFDQRSFMSTDQRMRWNRTSFPKLGRCTEYDVPKQWLYTQIKDEAIFYNLGQASCLNGWTCGNLAASAQNLASFWNDLIGEGKIVSPEGLKNMTDFSPLTQGFAPGLPYGLGLMSFYLTWPVVNPDYGWIGHAGQDYASGAPLCGYNVKYKFGVAVTMNSYTGMNCSGLSNKNDQEKASNHVSCRVHNKIVEVLSNGTATPQNCGDDESSTATITPATLFDAAKQWRMVQTIQTMKTEIYSSLMMPTTTNVGAGAASTVTEPGTCKGSPELVIPYIADGNCQEMQAQYGGPFWYTALMNASSSGRVVTVKEYFSDQSKNANLCQGNTSSPPHGKSPFTVPVDTCFRVPSSGKGGSDMLDILFYLNETTGIVAEVIWKVDSIKSCSWLESGIPSSNTPAPAPVPGTQEFLVQNYKSNDCDPTTVAGAGAAAWEAVPFNECSSMGSNVFFKMSCQGGTNVTVLLNCKDASCTEGCNSDVLTLGGCSETSIGGSSRIIYLGGGECPQ